MLALSLLVLATNGLQRGRIQLQNPHHQHPGKFRGIQKSIEVFHFYKPRHSTIQASTLMIGIKSERAYLPIQTAISIYRPY